MVGGRRRPNRLTADASADASSSRLLAASAVVSASDARSSACRRTASARMPSCCGARERGHGVPSLASTVSSDATSNVVAAAATIQTGVASGHHASGARPRSVSSPNRLARPSCSRTHRPSPPASSASPAATATVLPARATTAPRGRGPGGVPRARSSIQRVPSRRASATRSGVAAAARNSSVAARRSRARPTATPSRPIAVPGHRHLRAAQQRRGRAAEQVDAASASRRRRRDRPRTRPRRPARRATARRTASSRNGSLPVTSTTTPTPAHRPSSAGAGVGSAADERRIDSVRVLQLVVPAALGDCGRCRARRSRRRRGWCSAGARRSGR